MSETIAVRSDTADPSDLFHLIVDSATDFGIFTLALDGTVTSWNTGAERLLGYSEDEIVGKPVELIFTSEDRKKGEAGNERRIACAEGRSEDERWHVRKDGTRFWASGITMLLNKPASGFAKILRDLTKRHVAQERVLESEARFRVLATSIPQLVFRTRSDGCRLWGSPQWIDYAGLSLEESVEFGWLDAVHPDDREPTLAAWQASRGTDEHYSEQRVRRQADGQYRWHQTRARRLPEAGDEWVGTMTDIHELKTLQGRQSVLVAELQHRTRNLLAVVQSTAKQTMRSADSLDEFAPEFDGRLRALSRVQGLLARVEHHDVDLREMIEIELTAHVDPVDSDKVTIDGPAVCLPATSAQAVALAIHELATNAVKHGALAAPSGKLAVTWQMNDSQLENVVVIEWRESGVPMRDKVPPKRRGYGTELIERALPYQLNAKTRLEFGPDGVRCSIVVPLPAAQEQERESVQ